MLWNNLYETPRFHLVLDCQMALTIPMIMKTKKMMMKKKRLKAMMIIMANDDEDA